MLGQGRLIKSFMVLAMLTLVFSGCSSNKKKYELRDKIASSSGLFCDFVNGDKHKEVEVELNVSMARKCDPEKPFSVTGYRNASEVHGLMYCCSMKKVAASTDTDKSSTTKVQTPATKMQKDNKDLKDTTNSKSAPKNDPEALDSL